MPDRNGRDVITPDDLAAMLAADTPRAPSICFRLTRLGRCRGRADYRGRVIRIDRSAAVAGFAVPAGALVMLVALVAVPGSWLGGYVSEAGTTGQPLPALYRSGLILLAAGVAALGVSVRRPAALLLGPAALLAATSGAVPCSAGCPLPPYEPTTGYDVVHTGASILGMIFLAGAMLTVALTAERPAARRLAWAATALTVPLGGWLGLIMLLVGRGPLGATLERFLLVVAVCWLTGTAWLRARSADPPDDRQRGLRPVLEAGPTATVGSSPASAT